jgi:hypothetical protein
VARTTWTRLPAVAAIAVAAAVLVAGCGSSGNGSTTPAGSELATWAGGLCKAVGKYKASLAAARASLHVRQISRPALQVAVQDASAATRQLGHDLEELGPPPAAQVDGAGAILTELGSNLSKQTEKVRAVTANASSTGDVRQAAGNISDALTAATDEASRAVGELGLSC